MVVFLVRFFFCFVRFYLISNKILYTLGFMSAFQAQSLYELSLKGICNSCFRHINYKENTQNN